MTSLGTAGRRSNPDNIQQLHMRTLREQQRTRRRLSTELQSRQNGPSPEAPPSSPTHPQRRHPMRGGGSVPKAPSWASVIRAITVRQSKSTHTGSGDIRGSHGELGEVVVAGTAKPVT